MTLYMGMEVNCLRFMPEETIFLRENTPYGSPIHAWHVFNHTETSFTVITRSLNASKAIWRPDPPGLVIGAYEAPRIPSSWKGSADWVGAEEGRKTKSATKMSLTCGANCYKGRCGVVAA